MVEWVVSEVQEHGNHVNEVCPQFVSKKKYVRDLVGNKKLVNMGFSFENLITSKTIFLNVGS